MGRPAWLGTASACLLAGCAQLAGIDETSGGTQTVIGRIELQRVSIGASLVLSPLDIAPPVYLFENPNAADGFDRVTSMQVEDGVWSVEIGDGMPAVMFVTPDYPDPITRIWQLPNPELRGTFQVLEHPNPEPAPDPAMLTVQAALPSAVAAGESFQFYAVGTWNARSFSGMEAPAVGATAFDATFAFTTMNQQTGRPYEKITTADATLLLRYNANTLTGVMEGTPFEQTAADTVTGTLTAVTPTEMMSATINNMTIAARYMPPRPMMPAPNMSWTLSASPGYAYGVTSGVSLDSASVLATDPSEITSMFGNPFTAKGWQTMLRWATSASRSFTPPGAVGAASLSAQLVQLVEPTPGVVLDLPAGMPELITLDEMPLSSDGIAIAKPQKAVRAEFVVPPSAANILFHLNVNELVPNAAGTALVQKTLVALTSTTPSFLIPPEFFQPGKAYTLRAITNAGGYPELANGDLATRSLPLAFGSMDSGVILVNP